jgi:hypothetical protein
MDPKTRKRLLDEHLEAIRNLESQETDAAEAPGWPPNQYYLLWHVVIGMMIGGFGALVSLLANAVGAPIFGQPALQLIRVYLTFPMGARALEADQGLVLFVGCTLYIVTGALYGVGFHLAMSSWFADASRGKRFAIATAIGVGLWIVNFYLILSWLQPLLLGDNWIVRLVPVWVGLGTHLAFAWAMLIGEFWGQFEAYRSPGRRAA